MRRPLLQRFLVTGALMMPGLPLWTAAAQQVGSQSALDALRQAYEFRRSGDMRLACDAFLQAFKTAVDQGDRKTAANAQLNYAPLAAECTAGNPAVTVDQRTIDAYSYVIDNGSVADSSLARNNLGVFYLKTNRSQQALKALKDIPFRSFAELPPEQRPAPALVALFRSNLARAYLATGHPPEALAAFSDALEAGARWEDIQSSALDATQQLGKMARSEYVSINGSLTHLTSVLARRYGVLSSLQLVKAFVAAALEPAKGYTPPDWLHTQADRLAFDTLTSATVRIDELKQQCKLVVKDLSSVLGGSAERWNWAFALTYYSDCDDWQPYKFVSLPPDLSEASYLADAMSVFLSRIADALFNDGNVGLAFDRAQAAWKLSRGNSRAARLMAALLSARKDIDPNGQYRAQLLSFYNPQHRNVAEAALSPRANVDQRADPGDLVAIYTYLGQREEAARTRERQLLYTVGEPVPNLFLQLADEYRETDRGRAANYYRGAQREFELAGSGSMARDALHKAIELEPGSARAISDLRLGQAAVAGTIQPASPLPDQLWAEIETAPGQVSRADGNLDAQTRLYFIDFHQPIAAGDNVQLVTQTQGQTARLPMRVVIPKWYKPGALGFAPQEGDTVVTGTVPARAASVSIQVLTLTSDCLPGESPHRHTEQFEALPDPVSGQFSVNLYRPLQGGEIITVWAYPQTDQSGPTATMMVGSPLGSTRLYASAGTAFVRAADWRSNVALSATFDKAFFSYTRLSSAGCSSGAPRKSIFGLHLGFEGRLEPLSFIVRDAQSDQLRRLSAQSTALEINLRAPILLQDAAYQYRSITHAFATSPIVRLGLEAHPASIQTLDAATSRFGKFLAWGFRFEALEFISGVATAPLQTSAVEITMGRWDRFATVAPDGRVLDTPWRGELRYHGPLFRFPSHRWAPWLEFDYTLNFGSGPPEHRLGVHVRYDLQQVLQRLFGPPQL